MKPKIDMYQDICEGLSSALGDFESWLDDFGKTKPSKILLIRATSSLDSVVHELSRAGVRVAPEEKTSYYSLLGGYAICDLKDVENVTMALANVLRDTAGEGECRNESFIEHLRDITRDMWDFVSKERGKEQERIAANGYMLDDDDDIDQMPALERIASALERIATQMEKQNDRT